MKKFYNAPSMEFLAFCSSSAIGTGEDEMEAFSNFNSDASNDGELGWT